MEVGVVETGVRVEGVSLGGIEFIGFCFSKG